MYRFHIVSILLDRDLAGRICLLLTFVQCLALKCYKNNECYHYYYYGQADRKEVIETAEDVALISAMMCY